MIDTDKYTGHTPVREEWPRWCEDWLFSVYADDGSHIPNWNQDNNLACDAPLLLEEVKRWHKVYEYIHHLYTSNQKTMSLHELMELIDEVVIE